VRGESDTTFFVKIKKEHPSPGGPEASPPGLSPLGDTTYHDKRRKRVKNQRTTEHN